jgi:hypothetical protein
VHAAEVGRPEKETADRSKRPAANNVRSAPTNR